MTVVLPTELHRLLKIRGIDIDMTMNDQIIEAVKLYLHEHNSDRKDS